MFERRISIVLKRAETCARPSPHRSNSGIRITLCVLNGFEDRNDTQICVLLSLDLERKENTGTYLNSLRLILNRKAS
jgi:hypothetical protein